MVIHIEGATVTGTPNLPEYLKADVYLPPHLVDEHPECHVYIVYMMISAYIPEGIKDRLLKASLDGSVLVSK